MSEPEANPGDLNVLELIEAVKVAARSGLNIKNALDSLVACLTTKAEQAQTLEANPMTEDLRKQAGQIHFENAQGFLLIRQSEKAFFHACAAARLVPEDKANFDLCGSICSQTGDHEQAIVFFGKVIELDDADFAARLDHALAHLRLKRFDEGLQLLRGISEDNRAEEERKQKALVLVGIVLGTDLGRHAEALAHFEGMKKASDTPSRSVLYHIASATEKLARYEEAIVKYDEVLAAFPDDEDVLERKGLIYSDRLNDEERAGEAVAQLYALHRAGKLQRPNFRRSEFDVKGVRVVAEEFYELTSTLVGWGRMRGKLKYRFFVLERGEEEKIAFRISLGSYDDTNAMMFDQAPGARSYHLDGYFPGSHKTFGFFRATIENPPEFAVIKARVIQVLQSEVEAISSTTSAPDGPKIQLRM